jgi:hypothetical protein
MKMPKAVKTTREFIGLLDRINRTAFGELTRAEQAQKVRDFGRLAITTHQLVQDRALQEKLGVDDQTLGKMAHFVNDVLEVVRKRLDTTIN